jgi:septal ring factor EnvC (AmiA/AmiB activator)
MRNNKNIILCLICVIQLLPLVGCSDLAGSNAVLPSDPDPQPDSSIARRFFDTGPKEPTTVESMIELSEKYAALSEEASRLRQHNSQLAEQNQSLEKQLHDCTERLGRTQKELAQANDLLVEMRIELNNWKNDVIGFRGEMRNAETAQLEALLKILKLLGAETQPALATAETTTPLSGRTDTR